MRPRSNRLNNAVTQERRENQGSLSTCLFRSQTSCRPRRDFAGSSRGRVTEACLKSFYCILQTAGTETRWYLASWCRIRDLGPRRSAQLSTLRFLGGSACRQDSEQVASQIHVDVWCELCKSHAHAKENTWPAPRPSKGCTFF